MHLESLDVPRWTRHAGRATLDASRWTRHAGRATLDVPRWLLEGAGVILAGKRHVTKNHSATGKQTLMVLLDFAERLFV